MKFEHICFTKYFCNIFAYQAKQRRRELQKMRALVTYQEKKFRREKRIKSKKYVQQFLMCSIQT